MEFPRKKRFFLCPHSFLSFNELPIFENLHNSYNLKLSRKYYQTACFCLLPQVHRTETIPLYFVYGHFYCLGMTFLLHYLLYLISLSFLTTKDFISILPIIRNLKWSFHFWSFTGQFSREKKERVTNQF
jgi:hypothetical protein